MSEQQIDLKPQQHSRSNKIKWLIALTVLLLLWYGVGIIGKNPKPINKSHLANGVNLCLFAWSGYNVAICNYN
jgi:hypothetical protein